jgi:hypothetical protein
VFDICCIILCLTFFGLQELGAQIFFGEDMQVDGLAKVLEASLGPYIESKLGPLFDDVSFIRERVDRNAREVDAKYMDVLEKHSELNTRYNALMEENKALHVKMGEKADDLNKVTLELGKVNERHAKAVHIGQDGESELRSILQRSLGASCVIRDTHSTAHSGDFVIEFVSKQGEPLSILIDCKNYNSSTTIWSAHVEKAVQDAIKQKADAAIVCYQKLPKKYQEKGFCEMEELAYRYSSPYPLERVLVSSFDSIIAVVFKLMLSIQPRLAVAMEESLGGLQMLESVQGVSDIATRLATGLTSLLKESAPLLDLLDSKSMLAAARDFQVFIDVLKRWAAAPPFADSKVAVLDATSVIAEKGCCSQRILGCNLSSKFDYSDRRSVSLKQEPEEEASGVSKKRKMVD